MKFFTDTNIPLGYTVIHDKWHDQSIKFITDHQKDSIFWSNMVKHEYNENLNQIIDNSDDFLNYCKSSLKTNQKDFINYFEFENFLIKRTKSCRLDKIKKQKILEEFWRKYHFDEGIAEEVYSKFSAYSHNFQKIYINRQKKLKKIMILHDCGMDNYLKYYNYAEQLFEWGVHKPDCKIITDAHDCGLAHDNLIFVTNDNEMLEKIVNHDHLLSRNH
jgi:hypothetical protein